MNGRDGTTPDSVSHSDEPGVGELKRATMTRCEQLTTKIAANALQLQDHTQTDTQSVSK